MDYSQGQIFLNDPVFDNLFKKWWREKDEYTKLDIFVSYIYEHQQHTFPNIFTNFVKILDHSDCKEYMVTKLKEYRERRQKRSSPSKRNGDSPITRKKCQKIKDHEELADDALYMQWREETGKMFADLMMHIKTFFGSLLPEFLYIIHQEEVQSYIISRYRHHMEELKRNVHRVVDSRLRSMMDEIPSQLNGQQTNGIHPEVYKEEPKDENPDLDRDGAYEIAAHFSSIQRAAACHDDSPMIKYINWDKLKVDLIKNHLMSLKAKLSGKAYKQPPSPEKLVHEIAKLDKNPTNKTSEGIIQLILHYLPREDILVNTKVSVKVDKPERCVACSAEATGVHYGRKACNECRDVFKSVIEEHKILNCPNKKKNCNKPHCKRCRFRKCLVAGMNYEEVEMLMS